MAFHFDVVVGDKSMGIMEINNGFCDTIMHLDNKNFFKEAKAWCESCPYEKGEDACLCDCAISIEESIRRNGF